MRDHVVRVIVIVACLFDRGYMSSSSTAGRWREEKPSGDHRGPLMYAIMRVWPIQQVTRNYRLSERQDHQDLYFGSTNAQQEGHLQVTCQGDSQFLPRSLINHTLDQHLQGYLSCNGRQLNPASNSEAGVAGIETRRGEGGVAKQARVVSASS